jgi:hypothetical protein
MKSEVAYEAAHHNPVGPGQFLDLQLLRQREHYVQQREEAWRFHRRPSYLPWDVEPEKRRCLALRIPVEQPLKRRDLRAALTSASFSKVAQ